MIEITIRGEPVAMGRPRGTKTGIFYTPTKSKEAMRLIGHEARIKMGTKPLLQGPLKLHLIFTYTWPKSTSKKKLAGPNWKDTNPDLDNLEKLVCDAFNKVVWNDDAQVVHKVSTKVYGPIPSISVLVSEMAEDTVSHLSVA